MIQPTHIVPLRTGWDPHPTAPPWYPDDLPGDWRLGYFSNAFRAVLVPATRWRRAGPGIAGIWAADTPERFRFYLEGERRLGGTRSAADLEPFARVLGGRLGGLVMPASRSRGDGAHPRPQRVLASLSSPYTTPGAAWAVPESARLDPRTARSWIEDRVREAPPGPVLALLGDCDFTDLERWQILIEMMGLA